MLSGDNGLLKRAGDARDDTVVGQEKEQVELAYISATVKKLGDNVTEGELQIELDSSVGNEKTDVSTNDDDTLDVYFIDTKHNYTVDNGVVTIAMNKIPIVTIPPTTAVTENTKYKDTNNAVAVIPTGFRVSGNTDEQTIETGLVVYDGNNNEWVWIPVEDATEMYTTEGAPYSLMGSTGVTTSMASKTILNEKIRTLPGENSNKEPDLALGWGEQNDYVNYALADFDSLEAMAQCLTDDYREMIQSIKKNKGFFVGRYELTGSVANPKETSGVVLTNQNWYNLYKACKKFTIANVVESRMIWGCQWDVVCNYIAEDINYSIVDSSSWGNYKTTAVKSSDGSTIIKAGGTSTKLNTGRTTFTMAKNIYDIAGNCEEWTQEAFNLSTRTSVGGIYSGDGAEMPASSFRNGGNPKTEYGAYKTSRPTLYIK